MAKYLFMVSFTPEGAKGLAKDGGSARRAATEEAVKSVGGTLESYYFAMGEADAIGIVDMPDNVSVAAVSLAAVSSGAVSTKTLVLLTPEEMDQAAQKTVSYRPPGQ